MSKHLTFHCKGVYGAQRCDTYKWRKVFEFYFECSVKLQRLEEEQLVSRQIYSRGHGIKISKIFSLHSHVAFLVFHVELLMNGQHPNISLVKRHLLRTTLNSLENFSNTSGEKSRSVTKSSQPLVSNFRKRLATSTIDAPSPIISHPEKHFNERHKKKVASVHQTELNISQPKLKRYNQSS